MSGLVPQTVEIRLGQRDRKTAEKLTTPGTLTRAENVEMTATGRYQKRSGLDFVGSVSGGKEIIGYENELVALTDAALSTFRNGGFVSKATGLDRHFTASYASAATSTDQKRADYAQGGGYEWHVWEDGLRAGVWMSVKNLATGDYVGSNLLVNSTGTRPAVLASGAFTIIAVVDTGNVLKLYQISHTLPLSLSGAVIVDTMNATAYDWTLNAGTLVLAYKFLSGTSRMRVRTWNVATNTSIAVVTSAAATFGDVAIGFLTHDFADSTYYLSALDATGWSQIRVPTNLASVTESVLDAAFAGGQVTTGWVQPGSLSAFHYASVHGTGLGNERTALRARASGGGIDPEANLFNSVLVSRPWLAATRPYMLVAHTSSLQSTIFAIEVGNQAMHLLVISARIFPGAAPYDRTPSPYNRLPGVWMTGDIASIGVMRAGPNSTTAGTGVTNQRHEAYKVVLTPWVAGAVPTQQAAGVVHVPGGFPRTYDHNLVAEEGFHLSPETPTLTAVAGTLATGTYQYSAIYSWTDGVGRRHTSFPSPIASITLGAPGGVNVVVNTLQYSARSRVNFAGAGPMEIELYRSDVNPGTGAPLRLRLRTMNSPANESVTFGDNSIALVSGEELYTLGDDSVIEDAPPPSMRFMWNWGNRTWGLPEESRKAFVFSKLQKPDFGVQWTEDFTGVVDDEFGELTAGCALGERNLLFKRDAVYWMSGAGQDDTGNGAFSEPQRLDGCPGTLNPRSLLSTDIGVFFQAPDNVIWLITPGLERIPLGDPCVDIQDSVASALLVPDKRQARFYTNNANGVAMVYDLTQRQWTTFHYFSVGTITSACMFNNQANFIEFAGGTGFRWRDNPAIFADDGGAYTSTLEFAWLSLGQLAGYMRTWAIHLLGENATTTELTAVLLADYGTATVTRALTLTSTMTNAQGARTEARVPLTMQQNTAMKLRLSWATAAAGTFALEALLLQCGFAPGRLPRLPTSHRMT